MASYLLLTVRILQFAFVLVINTGVWVHRRRIATLIVIAGAILKGFEADRAVATDDTHFGPVVDLVF